MSSWRIYRSFGCGLLLAAALALVWVAAPGSARAAPLCVGPAGAGGCYATLQAAIDAAAPGDTITIKAGTYTENVLVNKNLVLQGAGAVNTILDGATSESVVRVEGGAQVTMSGVTITHSAAPALSGPRASHRAPAMTVVRERHAAVAGITGAAAQADTTTVYIVGGGVLNYGHLLIADSIIRGNTAHWGGGIFNWGELTLINSTVSGNTADDAPYLGYGGGIANQTQMTLINSTLSGNSAGVGGGIHSVNLTTLVNTTLSENIASNSGGGIAFLDWGTPQEFLLQQSLLSGNRVSGDGYNPNCLGNFTTAGYNLVEEVIMPASSGRGCIVAGEPIGDIYERSAQLAPLADNGGPTPTHALRPGSPALDAVPPDCCSQPADQRGAPRYQGRGSDIGAYEAPFPKIYKLYQTVETAMVDPFEPGALGQAVGRVGFAPSMPNLRQAISLGPGGYVYYSMQPWYRTGPGSGYGADPRTRGTIELWVKPIAYGDILNFNWFAHDTYPPDGHVMHLRLNPSSGALEYQVWNSESNNPRLTGTSRVPLGLWTHLAVSWGPDGTRLFVNGKVEARSPANLYPAIGYPGQDSFAIELNSWGSGTFAGLVDELHLWTIQRTESDEFYRATGLLDRFARPNGPLGSGWSGPEGLGGYQIINGQLDVLGGGPIYWRAAGLGVAQEAFVTFARVDPHGREQDLLLKVQGNPPDWRNGAIEVLYNAAAGVARVETYQPGGANWKHYPNIPLALRDGDQFSARVEADGNVRLFRNGVPLGGIVLDSSDQAFFNGRGGRVGLWSIDAGGAVLDDFGGGTVTP